MLGHGEGVGPRLGIGGQAVHATATGRKKAFWTVGNRTSARLSRNSAGTDENIPYRERLRTASTADLTRLPSALRKYRTFREGLANGSSRL